MEFQNRAVEACRRDWISGRVEEMHIRDVLRCKDVDVQNLEEFLNASYPSAVRWAAARILMEKGRCKEVIVAAMMSTDRESLLALLSVIGKNGTGLEMLEKLLTSKDTMVRDAAVEMFRRAGKIDVLFPLVFDEDDKIVKRIKRYFYEAGQC